MSRKKNAKVSIERIEAKLKCHACSTPLPSSPIQSAWGREDISKFMFEEIICPNCNAINQLPMSLINAAAGIL